jgi:hypothetical protein
VVAGSSALKASIRAFVKDERTAGDLFAGKDFAQDNVVIARLVNRGDAATELGRGFLLQRQSVGAEHNSEIVI